MPKPTPSPSAPAPGSVLPFDSTLLFVLDDPITSKGAKAGQLIRAHLKSAIVVAGRVIAPAGTPGQIRIVDSSPSEITDVYGFVDIFFEPLALPDASCRCALRSRGFPRALPPGMNPRLGPKIP
jgi:hypothetical protein